MKKLFSLLALISAAAGCAIQLPAEGAADDGSETFSGVVDETGTLRVKSSRGSACEGIVHRFNAVLGEVILLCDDGRSGTLNFTSSGSDGKSKGLLDGKPVSISW
jgi:hypothetical protein